MADIVEKNLDKIEDVSKWVASEFKYLKEVKGVLNQLKKNISDPEKEESLAKALSGRFRHAGRSERRINRFFKRLLKKTNELKEILPSGQKSDLEKLETNMDIAAKKIIKEASVFVGKIKDDIGNLKVQISLLKREPSDKKVITNLNNLIADLTARTDETIKWLSSLSTSLENTKNFLTRLQESAKMAA